MKFSSVWFALPLAACPSSTSNPDLSGSAGVDMASPADQASSLLDMPPADLTGWMCTPVPQGSDGMVCPGSGCPGSLQGVIDQTGMCHCWSSCPTGSTTACGCGRVCVPLSAAVDGGTMILPNGACIPANGAAERCGNDPSGKPYGWGGCQSGLLCVQSDSTHGYCMYICTKQSDCPSGTTCVGLSNGNGMVCAMNEQMTGKAAGASCTPSDYCALGNFCDNAGTMTCKPQCDGPSGMCASGTCTKVVDSAAMKIEAYVCK